MVEILGAEPISDIPPAEIPRLVRLVASAHSSEQVRCDLKNKAVDTAAKLSDCRAQIEALLAAASDPFRYPSRTRIWAQDAFLPQLASYRVQFATLVAQGDAIERDLALLRDAVARCVTEAVAAAGGSAKIADAIRRAEILGHEVPPVLALAREEIAVLAGDLHHSLSVREEYKRLIGSGSPELDEACDGLAKRLAALEAKFRTEHARLAAELLSEARAGDEPARARIEKLTQIYPDAFPVGFAQKIHDSEFSQVAVSQLAALTKEI